MSINNKVGVEEMLTLQIPPKVVERYICISCYTEFTVFDRPTYAGLQPNNTLLCTTCTEHLRNCITREKTQNYGW
jgi:hypothetical protein